MGIILDIVRLYSNNKLIILPLSIGILIWIIKDKIPNYMLKSAMGVGVSFILITVLESSLIDSLDISKRIFPEYPEFLSMIKSLLFVLILFSVLCSIYKYWRINKKINDVVRYMSEEKFEYNFVKAWNNLYAIHPKLLFWKQKQKYEKYKLHLRMMLGNYSSVEEELERIKDSDRVYYHFSKFYFLNVTGHIKDAVNEIRKADEVCDADTESLLRLQILINRGVGYVTTGQYTEAGEFFEKGIEYGKIKDIKDNGLWANLYYNYIINRTRVDKEYSSEELDSDLEKLKGHLDVGAVQDCLRVYNIKIIVLSKLQAKREKLEELVEMCFEELINKNIPKENMCVFEASIAGVLWHKRLKPDIVLIAINKDIDIIQTLPMPVRYICFKQIYTLFNDLGGPIVERYKNLKRRACDYLDNQAALDLEQYRKSLPKEAIYEQGFCFMELAELLRKTKENYSWTSAMQMYDSAISLYKENKLLMNEMMCRIRMLDEACIQQNLNEDFHISKIPEMIDCLSKIEAILPVFEKHPILPEIYIHLSYYYLCLDQYDNCKKYYEKYFDLGDVNAFDDFMPCVQHRLMLISFAARVLYFLDAIEIIVKSKDLCVQGSTTQEWFKKFYEQNGFVVSILLGDFLGTTANVMLKTKIWSINGDYTDTFRMNNQAEHTWLVMPGHWAEVDLLYRFYEEDNCCEKIFFDYEQHPFETGKSNFVKKLQIPISWPFKAPRLSCIPLQKTNLLNGNDIIDIYNMIKKNINPYCPSLERLSKLYERTMLPIGPLNKK